MDLPAPSFVLSRWVPTNTEKPETEQPEIEVEVPENPEGAPIDEIEVDIPENPEGAPEEDIEEPIDIDVPENPEGAPADEPIDIDTPEMPEGLPQTGVASSLVFFIAGFACIGSGAAITRKVTKKEEE